MNDVYLETARLLTQNGKPKQPARGAISVNAQSHITAPTENREIARFYLWLRKEIERIATAPGVAEEIKALVNRVFPDRHDLATRAATKGVLSAQSGMRRNYVYVFRSGEEIVVVSVSATCCTPEQFLLQVRTGAYLMSVASLTEVLDRQPADPELQKRLMVVVALEFVIDLEAQGKGEPDFVHSYITAIPTALLQKFGSRVSQHPELRRVLFDPQLLTDEERTTLSSIAGRSRLSGSDTQL